MRNTNYSPKIFTKNCLNQSVPLSTHISLKNSYSYEQTFEQIPMLITFPSKIPIQHCIEMDFKSNQTLLSKEINFYSIALWYVIFNKFIFFFSKVWDILAIANSYLSLIFTGDVQLLLSNVEIRDCTEYNDYCTWVYHSPRRRCKLTFCKIIFYFFFI